MEIFITNPDYKSNVSDFIAEKTGLNFVAFRVNVISQIPKNEAGKTLYKELECCNV